MSTDYVVRMETEKGGVVDIRQADGGVQLAVEYEAVRIVVFMTGGDLAEFARVAWLSASEVQPEGNDDG